MTFKVLNNNSMSIFEDLMNREISVRGCSDPLYLQRNIVGSKYLIEKYELQSLLKGHTGCVNTVLFSEDGTRIFTGSDDTNVNIYLTETCKKIVTLPTIHTNNIFYARDLPGTDMTIMVRHTAAVVVVSAYQALTALRKLHDTMNRSPVLLMDEWFSLTC